MTSDNIAGHTAAQNTLGQDGLRDGDSLSPTTLTNLIQAVQGNGVLRYQDGAYGSTRNETNSGNQPGSMVRATSSTLTVSGGFVVLDGALYEFGSGVGNTVTIDFNNGSHGTGALALASNEEAVYTIYVAASGGNNKVHYEGGSPVDTTTGIYPSASSQYLIDYDTGVTQDNMKVVVLALVRVQYVSSGGGANNINIVEINDKRVFVEGSADYRVPLSVGTITSGEIADGGNEGVNRIEHLNALHNDNGELAITDTVNVHWVSHPRYGSFSQTPPTSSDAGYGQGPSRGADRNATHAADSFYFAGRNNEQTGHYAVRLQGRGVDATSTGLTTNGTWIITADGDSFFMLSPNTGVTITLEPEKDGSGNYMFPEGHMIEVCNEGLGDIVFDDVGGVNATISSTHRATFVYEGSEWIRCDYQSAIIANAPAIEISGGAPVFATGITQAEMLTLLGVEAGATADQTDAEIRAAVEAATDSNVFTDADHTKLDGIATGATAYTDADAIAAVEGESTLDLTGAVTVQTDLKMTTSSDDAIIENVTQDKDIIFKVNDGGVTTEVLRIDGSTGNVGIRLNQNVTADERLDVEDGNISLTTTSRTTERIIKLRNSGSTTSLSEIAMAGANSNNYEGYIAFKTKGPDDLYNDPLNEIMRIDGNGNVGIGTTSPDTKLHIEATSNPTLKLQETGQTGYLEVTSVVDSQAKITATNETASEFVILDIDAKANASTGTFQDVRLFRNAQSTVDGNFRIKQVGTATDVFHVYSDKDGTAHTMTMSGSAQITSDLEIDGALNHDGSTVGFFGTGPQGKTAVASLGAQTGAPTGAATPPGVGDTAHADFTTAINQLNTNINNIQTKLDDLISSLSNLGLV